MGFGDLTSGINMLPNDAINQGFRQMVSTLGNIEKTKAAEAQNKINQFNSLSNVVLKGLQGQAMDEAVAARDGLIKQLAQWEAQDGPMGLSWQHQKQALAMKQQLEDMVTANQENQTLAKEAMQTALRLKDPRVRNQYLNKVHKIMQMPILSQNQAWKALEIPKAQYDPHKAISSIPLKGNKGDYNINEVINAVKSLYENNDFNVKGFIDNYLEQNPEKTLDDAFKYLAGIRMALLPNSNAYKNAYNAARGRNDAKKSSLKNLELKPDTDNPNHYSLPGKEFKYGSLSFVDKNGKRQTLKNVEITGVLVKPDGSVVAEVTPSTNSLVTINSSGTGGSAEKQIKKKLNKIANVWSGSSSSSNGKEAVTVEVPIGNLRNYFSKYPNLFKNAPQIQDALYGKSEGPSGEDKLVIEKMNELRKKLK